MITFYLGFITGMAFYGILLWLEEKIIGKKP